jgi:hypothetical protein
MRFTPWETTKKYNDKTTRREADVEAGEERDIEQQQLGALNKSLSAQVIDITEHFIVQAAITDLVCQPSGEWAGLLLTNLSEACSMLEAAMAVRAEAADVDLGRNIE